MIKDKLKKYFVPTAENDYSPHILQKTAAGVMLALVLLSFTFANIQAIVLVSSNWFITSILPAVIVEMTNENRDDEKLDMLTRSKTLDAAAQLKANDMAEYSYFAHTSPQGVTPWYWFEQVNYTYAFAGENLAVHFTDSKEVVDAWMDSPGHRANILDGNYTEIGIGTAKGEYKGFPTVFVVQLFGTPAIPTTQAVVTQRAISAPLALDTASGVNEVAEGENDSVPDPADRSGDVEEIDVASAQDDISENPSTTPDVPITIDASGTPLAAESETPFTPPSSMLELEIATTSGIEPAVGSAEPTHTGQRSILDIASRLAAQPTQMLSILYSVLAMFVVVALVVSIAIEWRHQRPVQIAYGTGLLAAMTVMWYVQQALVSGALVT